MTSDKTYRDAGNVRGYADLTKDQTDALTFYRQNNGRLWKAKLLDDWRADRARNVHPDTSAVLRGLRNTHGPAWLARMQLKASP